MKEDLKQLLEKEDVVSLNEYTGIVPAMPKIDPNIYLPLTKTKRKD